MPLNRIQLSPRGVSAADADAAVGDASSYYYAPSTHSTRELLRRVRELLLHVATAGLLLVDPVDEGSVGDAPVGEAVTAEAIAVLQVG